MNRKFQTNVSSAVIIACVLLTFGKVLADTTYTDSNSFPLDTFTGTGSGDSASFALDTSGYEGVNGIGDSAWFVLDTRAGSQQSAPVIIASPQADMLLAGNSIMLSVSALGTQPLSYQWYHNGQAIVGATGPSLILNFISSAQSGYYWVVVSNAFGSVTSGLAQVYALADGMNAGVTNVRASQRPGTKLVDISYDLVNPQGGPLPVTVSVSTDNGTSFNLPATSFSPANGSLITPGNNRHVTWNAGADWNNQLSTQVKFRITASGTLTSDSLATTVDTRNGTPETPLYGNRPVVQEVTSPYCSGIQHAYFLDGVSLNVPFTANINWNGKTPGTIKFISPSGTLSALQYTRTYNVGYEFGAGGTLTVKAVGSDGTESSPYQVNFYVIGPPTLVDLADMFFLSGRYAVQKSYGWPFLYEGTQSVPNDDSGKEMPGCTGQPLLFRSTLAYGGEIGLDGSWNASLSLAVGSEEDNWNIFGLEVEPRVFGGLEGQFGGTDWSIGGFGGIGVTLSRNDSVERAF